jgi:Domain of unknown function (DUF2431)
MLPIMLNILTVGDGDFSASLAILRAYYHHGSSASSSSSSSSSIEENKSAGVVGHLVATTLLSSKEDVIRTYPSSKAILDELESDDYGNNAVTILYQVDATKLDTHPELTSSCSSNPMKHKKFDVILFHHPHLGYNHLDTTETTSQEQHALRHSSLLAHYFHSAQHLISDGGYIHVCLCSGAIQSWRLQEIVQHLELRSCVGSPMSASRPLLEPVLIEYHHVDGTLELQQEIIMHRQSQKPFGNNKTKVVGRSRRGHWLGRYGYRHQPTFPQVTEFQTNVSSSYHFFFQPTTITKQDMRGDDDPRHHGHVCWICRQEFTDPAALQAHQEAPALPAAGGMLSGRNIHR